MAGNVLSTEQMMRGAQEMREFYQSLGIRPAVTERALEESIAIQAIRPNRGGRPRKIQPTEV